MKWFQQIESKYDRFWSRLIRHQYRLSLASWSSIQGVAFNVYSQVGAHDKDLKWFDLYKASCKTGINPVIAIRYQFTNWLARSRSSYPKPNQLLAIDVSQAILDDHYLLLAKASIKSDMAKMPRLQERARTLFDITDDDDLELVVHDLMNQCMCDAVVKASLIGLPEDLDDFMTVCCDYLTAPSVYCDELGSLLPTKIRKLPRWKGGNV